MYTLYWYGWTLYSAAISSYIHKNMLRPAREVAGAEIVGLS